MPIDVAQYLKEFGLAWEPDWRWAIEVVTPDGLPSAWPSCAPPEVIEKFIGHNFPKDGTTPHTEDRDVLRVVRTIALASLLLAALQNAPTVETRQ